MTTLVPDSEADLDAEAPLPGRPRRRLLNRMTGPPLAVLIAALGFLGGIEADKGRGASSTAAVTRAAPSGAFAGAGGRASGASSARAGGGAGFAGPGGASGDTAGTVSSVSGRSLSVKTVSGNTITVELSSATTLKKDLSVGRNAIHPGDSITVTGISGSGGSIKASSISDSGASSS